MLFWPVLKNYIMRWMVGLCIDGHKLHFNPPTVGGLTQSTYDPFIIHFCTISIKCWQDQSRFNPLLNTIPCLRWVEHSWHAYNSGTTYATNTKLAKSTALHDPTITMKAGSCKPLVTKLASVLHSLAEPCLYIWDTCIGLVQGVYNTGVPGM